MRFLSSGSGVLNGEGASRRLWIRGSVLLAACWLAWTAGPASGRAAELDPAEVNQSIEQAIRYLKRTQKADGSWPTWVRYSTTPLCTLALLNAGVDPSDDHVARALSVLRKEDYSLTYEVSLQLMALCAGQPEKDLLRITNLCKWLVQEQVQGGANRGAWGYPNTAGDPSNAQFALLALYEAERTLERYEVLSPIPPRTWQWALEYWENSQSQHTGGWGYMSSNAPTGSMTSAGIASLIIANDRLDSSASRIQGGQVQCCGDPAQQNRIALGLEWLGNHFFVDHNPGMDRGMWWLYYLYALERVGRLSHERLIGGHDWYREGTAELLKYQDKISGSWRGVGTAEADDRIATSFSLLFLAKGRRPTLLAKLQYGQPGDVEWNRHPQDAANLTRYVETRWKRDLTWHVARAESATVDDLLQAPVLYISGSQGVESLMANNVVEALREYVHRGGFIFAEGCCNPNGKFDQSFRALMAKVFPENPLQQIGPEHEVWFFEEVPPLKTMYAGQLYGVNVGCRTSVIYCQHPKQSFQSLSCYWELARLGRQQQVLPDQVKLEVDTAKAIGINVLAYATGRQLRYKYEIPERTEVADIEGDADRARVIIAKLQHDGGWNAAPGALPSLQRELSRQVGMLVPTDQREVSLLSPGGKLFDYHMLFLHGRNEFSFNEEERKQLRLYVEERGGLILADTVCASEAFARSFRREMGLIFPEHKLTSIPSDDPIYSNKYGGFDLATVQRVQPARGRADGPVKADIRDVPPELEAVILDDGRYGVIFSPYDLSCALESKETFQCRGYTRESAARIGINVVLYSLHE